MTCGSCGYHPGVGSDGGLVYEQGNMPSYKHRNDSYELNHRHKKDPGQSLIGKLRCVMYVTSVLAKECKLCVVRRGERSSD